MSQAPHSPAEPTAAPSSAVAPTAPPRPVRFYHRGRIVEVPLAPTGAEPGTQAVSPTTTVLSWLREHAHCTGTKEGCNEGDCGACTVLVGSRQADGTLALENVNACIQFVPTLDGKALLTVEDLAAPARHGTVALHPVQQAMVDCHGSQCGFCTPGFVMSMTACYERHQAAGTRPTRQQLADDLAGNLCRCTGYRPILDAGEYMFTLPPQRLDTAVIAQALAPLASDPPLQAAGFSAPRTLAELTSVRAAQPEARLLAGNTDIGLWVNKQFRSLGPVIWLGNVTALKTIETLDGMLRIGAGASLEAAWTALAKHWPPVREMHLRFASPPIRHAGTMGGNVANGSPIGDSAPVLIALGASLVLRRGDHERRLLLQDFYVDYMVNRLEPGEFVQAIELPLPAADEVLRAYKLSKRYDSDISGIACGLWLKRDAAGTVTDVRFAFGGLTGIVKRAAGAEAAVRGQPWTSATVQAAMAALDADYTPLSDLRASAAYRRRTARNLLQRLWLETRAHDALPAHAVSVFATLEEGR